ncbi:MAG: hydroxymethylbilane synthase [Bdellovibrio sp.]|nr:hydroxymethylbilane synthase [Bdellovibrio sp.]
MKSVLKLGTRKSLLAMAQSQWVASEVEKKHPDIQVQLVGIETQGDRIQDVPLSRIEGKEFFVAEIDQSLMNGVVDFTVHSMKDLSLERPEKIYSGFVPKRENPRDVIVFGPQALRNLEKGLTLKIGTSSPRRLENIPSFLEEALPQVNLSASVPRVRFEEIRGNVNTRLSRVQMESSNPRYLDGVVLAFAGLVRLWRDPSGQTELSRLLQGCRWMILPLTLCPAAPAQGALMVECRKDDTRTRALLEEIHCPDTADQVREERLLLAKFGGGCHQRFGATQIFSPQLGKILFLKGKSSSGQELDDVFWAASLPIPSSRIQAWDGHAWRSKGKPRSFEIELPDLNGKSVFVAHARAVVSDQVCERLKESRIWVSGTQSWFKLARMGLWVEGCAENLGFEFLKETLGEPVLGLPQLPSWTVLTHESAQFDWTETQVRVIPTYEVSSDTSSYSPEALQSLSEATHIFWSSGSQWNALKGLIPNTVHHACGPGKTARFLQRSGLDPAIFLSVKEWKKWLQIQ